jgi:hypothetical protein
MRRRLFTSCCAASATVFLAVAVLWLRSYWTADFVARTRLHGPAGPGSGFTAWTASSLHGVLRIGSTTVVDRAPPDERPLTWQMEPARSFIAPPVGLSYSSPSTIRTPANWSRGQTTRAWMLQVPYGFLAVPPGVLPTAWVAWRLWSRRSSLSNRPGLCRRCGYDLRATPGQCPECGAVPEAGRSVDA